MNCTHCNVPIGQIIDPWGGTHGWIHAPQDGPDAYTYCGDNYGTDAEPGKSEVLRIIVHDWLWAEINAIEIAYRKWLSDFSGTVDNWEELADPFVAKLANRIANYPNVSIPRVRTHSRGFKPLCPQCKSSSEVSAYISEKGMDMRACGRCMIQWRNQDCSDCGHDKHSHITNLACERCDCKEFIPFEAIGNDKEKD